MVLTTDWDLTSLYEKEEDVLADVEILKGLTTDKLKFKGKLNNKESILEYYQLCEKLSIIETKVYCYLSLRKALNGKDVFSRELESKLEYFYLEIEPQLAFITPELIKNKTSKLIEYSKLPEFKNFDQDIINLAEEKKHILSEKINAVLSQNPTFGSNEEIFDNFNDVDLKFGQVKTKDGFVDLTHATYGTLIKSSDKKVRRETYDKMHKAFADFNYTLGGLYLNDVKEGCFFNKIHKYRSMLEACCKSDKTNSKVLETLICVVNENLKSFYRFEKLKKNYLKIKDYYCYDNYLEVGKVSKKFNYKESVKIVLEALSVMGESYTQVLNIAFENGWLDVYEKPSKTSGGFCLTVYGNHPYVLLNHNDTYNAVSTIAHEMGHAMHGYYSIKNHPIFKSSASIFICEVASIVNEILLANYMINNSQDKEEKLFYIHQLLFNFYTTIFRQTMFSEFEHFVYTQIENQKPIMVEDLNKKYDTLQQIYFGKEAKLTEYSKYEWSRIPHFYSPYYVYKYATGFISACTIANKILSREKGYNDKYIKFLSAGSSVKPIELLKTVDVDITKKSTLEGAFRLYNDLLDEFEKLTKEK